MTAPAISPGLFFFTGHTMQTQWDWTRVNNDTNGNGRFVCHFLPLVQDVTRPMDLRDLYKLACKRANKLGGRKYHTKSFGGGVVFQAYSSTLPDLERRILELQTEGGDA
jgi:hypothetical protein